jgi:hypothetical protein
MTKAKYCKIQIVNVESRFDDDSLTLHECGVEVNETFYADVYSSGVAWIRAKRDNADKSILAGDNLTVDHGDYIEVAE